MTVNMEPFQALSVTDVREQIRDALSREEAIRVAGRGTWMDAGHRVSAERVVSLEGLSGVVNYVPGDFTITVRAGTTLQQLAAIAADERQWLALDPFGAGTGTVGATIATGSSGPLAHAFGTPRDNVLGLKVVTGTGTLVTVGGRVVKNVAGFDLTRLFTGSWGTLGVVAEATLRLRALPEVDETYALIVDSDAEAMKAQLRALSAAPISPYALEMLNPALARRAGLGSATTVLVRLSGNAESVSAQRGAISRLGTVRGTQPGIWATLRECEPADAAVVRFARRPTYLCALWLSAVERAGNAFMHASVGRGIVRCMVRTEDWERLTGDAWWAPGSVIVERAEASLSRPGLLQDASSIVRARLSQRIKSVFDPANILNPGIMGRPH